MIKVKVETKVIYDCYLCDEDETRIEKEIAEYPNESLKNIVERLHNDDEIELFDYYDESSCQVENIIKVERQEN